MSTSDPSENLHATHILTLIDNQRHVLAQIAAGMPLADVLQELVLIVEAQFVVPLKVSIALAGDNGKQALHFAAPPLQELCNQIIEGHAPDRDAGSGADASSGSEPVHVADIEMDPQWARYRSLASAHGLRACWSMPIRGIGGESLGTLAVYHPEPKAPAGEDIAAMAVIAQTAALAIECDRTALALKTAEARHRQIFDSATDFAIVSTDLQGIVTSWNEGAHRILGWTEDAMVGQPLHRIFTPEDVAHEQPEIEMQNALVRGYAPDERWHVRNTGMRFWASGQMTPLKNDAGEAIGFVKIMRDQTAHRRADLRLQQLTQTLESEVAQRTRERDRIWRNSMDLLLVIGADGVVRAVNPAFTAILGFEPSELVGQHFMPFVHPEDVEPTVGAITRASQGPLDHFEVRLRHKDGSWHWIAWRAAPDEGLVYANGRDVTVEKRQAEQLSQANEARLQLALEAGEMGAWEWNPRSNTFLWLHGTAVMHGMPAEETVSMPQSDYMQRHVHPDDRDAFASALARAIEEGKHHRVEYRIVWPDGSTHWIEARGQMFVDGDGDPSQMVGVSINITRRKRTEQDLKFLANASAELASLVDPQSTLDRLAFMSVPTFADWCAVDLLQEDGTLKRVAVAHADPAKVRSAYERQRRFPSDPNMTRGVWNILRTGQAEFVHEITNDLLERLIPDPGRLSMMKKLGLRSYVGVPLSVRGKTLGVIIFFTAESGRLYTAEDMSLAEDLARRAAVAIENADLYRAMRRSDQAKDVFLATLAHELRNPLAAIVGGLGMVTLAADDSKRVEEYARLMERQAGQLTRLVDDLMDVSRIATGKITLKKEPASLAAILNSAIETSRAYIESGQHRLLVSLPGEPTDLSADPVRLSQVFSNLLTNAAKYTNPGGEISVTLECAASEFIVRVRDTGIGIAADMLKNVFKIFIQVTHPVERDQGGMGIGLSLVEGLVKLHGGRVEAFSAGPGQGSEFVVHLPRLQEHDAQVRQAASNASGLAQKELDARHILVVDDNVDAAMIVADILGMLGHEVVVAHDGLAAVSMAADLKPDVILLDIGLPGIDGYEVARRIRMQEPGERRPPILIALTGWGQEDDKQRAHQAGFDHHWVKPVGLAQLKEIAQLR